MVCCLLALSFVVRSSGDKKFLVQKEAKMKKALLSFTAFSSMIVFLFFVTLPVRAESVDDRIQAMEQELARLKAEQEETKSEQIELRKEALAAKDAFPKFRYRPGRGLNISAADKSWSWNIVYRLNWYMYFYEGDAVTVDVEDPAGTRLATGRGDGQGQPRRNRIYMDFCWADCFYEIEVSLDGENSRRTAQFRDSEFIIHLEQINPWLPTLSYGPRTSNEVYLGRSSSSGMKVEHNRVCGFAATTCTGSSSSITTNWEDIPVWNGEALVHVAYHTNGTGESHDFRRDTDRKGLTSYFEIEPFSNSKNKWLNNFTFAFGYHFNTIDGRANRVEDVIEPSTAEVETYEDRGQAVVFEASGIGSGMMNYFSPGIEWGVGPYKLRAVYAKASYEGEDDGFRGVKASGFEVAQGLFLWSPKGFLTGSRNIKNSVMLAYTFERINYECGGSAFIVGTCIDGGTGPKSNRGYMYVNEIALWWWWWRDTRVGAWVDFYNTNKTPAQVQVDVDCASAANANISGANRDCDWVTGAIGFQTRW